MWKVSDRPEQPTNADGSLDQSAQAILGHVLSLLRWLGGRNFDNGADRLIAAEHGVAGGDGSDLLKLLEQIYRIDIRPFMDARSTMRNGWLGSYRLADDATARELADHISSLLEARNEAV